MSRCQIILFNLLLILGVSCSSELPKDLTQAYKELPDKIDYNFHVKPILSDRCFACHGPDAQNRKADLRLDIEEAAFAALESGHHAIVAGDTKNSNLVERILSSDPAYQMPPAESNLTLSAYEKALLIKWIDQGAEYKPHWAFLKPEAVAVPKVQNKKWARNEIDHFVLANLEDKKIEPAPEADKEHLIRRLYFDLTGLPPSRPDLNSWINNKEEDWYEKLVDELLAKPAYGERMAAHWLDVARFADSEGYLDDFHHTFWPYRDWVIKAFNKNLSYDQFILWQVGGDQAPDVDTEKILATSFNRNHKQNSEGGVIPEEFRVEQVADRTNTVGTAFMGLTFGCARCHDHKYDPISQENYFQLFGFFNSTIERGDGIFSNNAIEYGQMVSNYQSMNAGPVLALPDEEVREIRDFLLKDIDKKQEGILRLEKNNEEAFQNWVAKQKNPTILSQVVKENTVSHLPFDNMKNGKDIDLVKSEVSPTYWGEIESVPGKKGRAVRSDAYGQYVANGYSSAFERMEPFTISFWINTPKFFKRAHVIYNGNNRIQGYRGWDVVLDSNRVHFRLNHAHPYQSLEIRTQTALENDTWTHFVWTYDGSSKAEGMRLYQNGEEIEPEILRNYIYRSSKPYMDYESTVYMPYKGIIIGNRHYDQDFTGGLLDEFRVLNKESSTLVAKYLYDEKEGKVAFAEALSTKSDALGQFFDLFIDADLEEARVDLRAIQAKEVLAIDTVQEIMVMGDYENERPTYILERGVYDAHGKRVKKGVPNDILPWPDELPKNRYGLGQWLIHPDHPLTSRVAVNQIWYLMFGRGLVESVEDFGNQGALPSHPELLDWLALDFQESGWDLKGLIKQMVSSATYRQSSKIRPELEEIDPDNYLLARSPRYRRSAEMIRDNILATSGLLDPKIGGPSTFPYQPPGLWKEVMTHTFFPEYEIDYENGLYRRSIYTFWKRNMPAPSMLIFDASSRAECQVRRQRSSTPLQALVMLNDPQMLEGCRVLAEACWTESKGDVEEAIEKVYLSLTSRIPTDRENSLLKAQYLEELAYFEGDQEKGLAYLDIGHRKANQAIPTAQLAALSRVANTVLNSTEGYYKN